MSISLPQGFRAHVANIGIKDSSDDFTLVVADTVCSAAGMFTQSRFAGPSVVVSREHIADHKAKAVVVISKNANVATGDLGMSNAREVVAGVSSALACDPRAVLIASTGVIGRQYPMDKVRAGLAALPAQPQRTVRSPFQSGGSGRIAVHSAGRHGRFAHSGGGLARRRPRRVRRGSGHGRRTDGAALHRQRRRSGQQLSGQPERLADGHYRPDFDRWPRHADDAAPRARGLQQADELASERVGRALAVDAVVRQCPEVGELIPLRFAHPPFKKGGSGISPPFFRREAGRDVRGNARNLVQIHRIFLQQFHGNDFQRADMRSFQMDSGRHVVFRCFQPSARTQAPAVAGLQAGEVVFRHRRG